MALYSLYCAEETAHSLTQQPYIGDVVIQSVSGEGIEYVLD